MIDLYLNIKKRREELGLTQSQLAERIGYADKTMISKIEKGLIDLPQSKILLIAEALRTSASALMGWSEPTETDDIFSRYPDIHPIGHQKIPMLGEIACGQPIFMSEEFDVMIELGQKIDCDFCLRCKGDSMIDADIHDGDVVFIKKDVDIINGRIYAVSIDDESTLKRVYWDKESQILQLVAANPAYPPMTYTGADAKNITIMGLAVKFLGTVK